MSEAKFTASELTKGELEQESTDCTVNENQSESARLPEHSSSVINQSPLSGTRNSTPNQNRHQRCNLPKEAHNQDLSRRKPLYSSLPRPSSSRICKDGRPRWNSSNKIDRRDYSSENPIRNSKPVSPKYYKLRKSDQSVYDRLYKISSLKRSKSSPPIKFHEEAIQNVNSEDMESTLPSNNPQNMTSKTVYQAEKGGSNHRLNLPISCQSQNECSKHPSPSKSTPECRGIKASKVGQRYGDCQEHTLHHSSNHLIIDEVQEKPLIPMNKEEFKLQNGQVIKESPPPLSTPVGEFCSTDTLETYESEHALMSIESDSHHLGPITVHLINQTDHVEICSPIRAKYNRTHSKSLYKGDSLTIKPTDTTEHSNSPPSVLYTSENKLMLEDLQYDSDIQSLKMSPKTAIVSTIDESNIYNIIDTEQKKDGHEANNRTLSPIAHSYDELSNYDELSAYSLSLPLTDLYDCSDYEDEYLFDQNNPSEAYLRNEISMSNADCWNRRFGEYATEFAGFYDDFSDDFLWNDEALFINVSNAKGLDRLHSFSDDISATIAEMQHYVNEVNEIKTKPSNSNFAIPPEISKNDRLQRPGNGKTMITSEKNDTKLLQTIPLTGGHYTPISNTVNNKPRLSAQIVNEITISPQNALIDEFPGNRRNYAKLQSPEYILRRYPPERLGKEMDRLRVALIGLHVRFKNAGITNRADAKELRQSYRGLILALRDLLKSEKDNKCMNVSKSLRSIMIQCVEQFAVVITNKVIPNSWLPEWDKACLMRHSADFIRYLCELFPENESYRKKCHDSYRIARSFYIENGLKDRIEWVHLNLNYSVFLYMIGDTRMARIITESMLNSSLLHRYGGEVQRRLEMNLEMYGNSVLT